MFKLSSRPVYTKSQDKVYGNYGKKRTVPPRALLLYN